MNEGLATILRHRVQQACVGGMRKFVDVKLRAIQESISVPVEYRTGPRGGVVVIRSAPGEAPRRETMEAGGLLSSVQTTVDIVGDTVVGSIFTNCVYAQALDLGNPDTNLAPRPWWTPAKANVAQSADELKGYVAEEFGPPSGSAAAAAATATA